MFSDKRLLLYLFISLRVLLLMVYQPQLIDVNGQAALERGLTTLGDYREHFDLAQSTDLPYRDYWVEFPPVWTAITESAVLVAQDNFTAWASLITLLMIAVDAGNMLLLWQLGTRLHKKETGAALAWIYTLMAAPLFMVAWNFEVLVLFSILGGLLWMLEKRPAWAGRVLALGILTKYVPVLVLVAIWRFRKQEILITETVIGLVALVLIPLLLWGGRMALKSLTIQADKPSYQTIWALLDGNYGTGSFPGGAARYDLEAGQAGRKPAMIPGWLRSIPFIMVAAWLWRLPLPKDDADLIAFFTVILLLFMLWSQGWSPQWVILLIPLILLNIPDRVGVLLALALIIGALLEYPVLFRLAANAQNQISSPYRPLFAMLILTRTVLLGGLAGWLIQRLRLA